MKVLIFPTASEAIASVADRVLDEVKRKASAVLGLATGGTMEAVYDRLVLRAQVDDVSFANVKSFNLDEYWGLPPDHPASYHTYMRERLFERIDIKLANTRLPRGDRTDAAAECRAYEAAIANAGGIDLQLLGIGRNGHIGFNEPTSSLASRTRVKTLTEATRQANAAFFDRPEHVPPCALTMGIGTILDARACVLLAIGSAKSAAVAKAIEGPVAATCPASALQLHGDMTMVLDREAAVGLTLIDYYQSVHPDGAQIGAGDPCAPPAASPATD
ncbi:glucosamine-6-phosphate deaminase [Jiella sp. MQZ9-1]|uniref:Glucosamine-6-phosphate deaminase n=1 Tax=Jiella flava TaxID=2816857 RepID=A0A939JVB9_9HYPH|nr:glucosamine-6-phosphate deaminase [Jiella flava]MBO0661116.1 glucosamine-6-phosphate deaminase [Jiella flava]MCD2469762.1 glucosamine-6-phosphate deaminase [Jiella flava]